MPLTSIRLRNFKCFQDSGDIPLAPLTVIFGRNNTGKSSILHSLLLLRQTLDAPMYEPRLNLKGLTDAGTYADLVHQHRSKQHVIMHFGITAPLSRGGKALVRRNGRLQLEFASGEPEPPRLVRMRIENGVIEPLEVRRSVGAGGPYELFIGEESAGNQKEARFFFTARNFLPFIDDEPKRVGHPNYRRQRSREFARFVLRSFMETLQKIRALGAFRRPPERRYEYGGRVPEAVDTAGANVVSALIEDMTRRRHPGELLRSVNRWLRNVGRIRLLPLRRISKSARLFEIRLKDTDSGRWANFADVGFGIGQALPVFVEGLRTSPGGTFLVQEPEIHLHPDAQFGMADFLVDLALSGRRVIAETHSEHLLLRIRHAIVTGKLRRSNVSVIYVDKGADGASHAHALEIDPLGQIKDWPKGFMEEATDERLGLLEDMAGVAESQP